MDMSAVEAYFVSPQSHKPFYLVVGDEDYKDALVALSSRVTSVLRVSNYCHTPDRKPNLDRLKDDLQTADVSCEHNRVLVLGLGEYLALEGIAKVAEHTDWKNSLYQDVATAEKEVKVRLIPYYIWGNRGETDMSVWLPVSK